MSEDWGRERTGIQVFQGEGMPLDEDIMPFGEMDESVVDGYARAKKYTENNPGDRVRCLFREDKDDGLSLVHCWFKSGVILPQHSHSADCLYYIVGGELRMGSRVLKKGEGFFVPADTHYSYEAGPEGVEVLEFRNASRFDVQHRGESWKHWDRIIDSLSKNSGNWPEETVPPSER